MISCKSFTHQEQVKNVNSDPTIKLDTTEYRSELAISKNVNLIDSLIKAPLLEGNMSTYESSGYGIRAKKVDSIMKDLMNQIQLIQQNKILTLKYNNDHKVGSDSQSSYSPTVPNYYALYSREVQIRKIGCIDPIAIVEDSETEGYEELHKSIIIKIQNYCNVKIKSVVLFLDFEGGKEPTEMDTDCRWVKRINTNINSYSDQKFKIPINIKCSILNGKIEVLEYTNDNGEKIKTRAGSYYQFRKESDNQK